MSEQQLLELAAAAAGMEGFKYSKAYTKPMVKQWTDERGRHLKYETWDPLNDDGDALRLAVKLGISIDPDGITYPFATTQSRSGETISEAHNDDPCAATRRAIVRAAAEISRSTNGINNLAQTG